MVDEGAAVVGTPEDAIAQIRRLQEKQGAFGVFLQLAHNWADFDKTKKSYELWRRHVSPAINRMNDQRQDSFDFATGNARQFIKAAMDAAA
ncbi:MAG: LLM class flavin-dependent oxidoreductase, partial [Xanthobacteraceae bacterium]